MRSHIRARLHPLAVAAGATVAASALAALTAPHLPDQSEGLVFILAVAFAGYRGGLASGVIALALSLGASLLLISPVSLPPGLDGTARWVLAIYVLVGVSISVMAGHLRRITRAETSARARAEWLADRLQDVHTITQDLLTTQPVEGLLRDLPTRVRQAFGAHAAALLLLDQVDGGLSVGAADGLSDGRAAAIRIPPGHGVAGRVALERRWIIVADAAGRALRRPRTASAVDPEGPASRAAPLEQGLRSILAVPMVVSGSLIGVLEIGAREPGRFGEEEASLLQLVADRVALAVENARQYEAQQRRAESLDALVKVATEIHGASRIEEVMQAIAEAARRLAGSGVAFAGFFRGRGEPDPTEYRQWEVAGYPREAFQHLDHLHITPLFEPTFRGRGAVRADDVRTHPLFRGLPEGHVPVVSYLAVPVVARSGQTLGAILLGHPEPGRFDEHVQTQVEALARQAGLALENALLYEREHSTAATLQRSLLPERVPEIPGVGLAARYQPSGTGEVGGDWYDLLDLDDGNLALVMGDVVGRGVRAAAIMGQVRNALRAYALEDSRPKVVGERLNALSERFGAPNLITLVYMVIDLSTLTARYIRAGHLPPVLVPPDGPPGLLEGGHALPLGVDRNATFAEGLVRIAPGSTLILYTDGLVDHPEVPLEQSFLRLREVALGAHAQGPEALVDALLRDVLPNASRHDDAAVLALTVVPQGDRISLRAPAEPSAVVRLRKSLRRWFAEQGIPPEAAFSLLVAAGEALSNAIEHAYGPGGGPLELDALREDDRITITVRDHGQWRPARGTNRGRGFRLMEAMVDEVAVAHEREGTEVRLRRRIGLTEEPA